ncbi:hypothetical protein HDU92_007079 [Lobulomyces angularis]|nr:hypothetical protein HDU92_007079 [Lobulomyces angularis]
MGRRGSLVPKEFLKTLQQNAKSKSELSQLQQDQLLQQKVLNEYAMKSDGFRRFSDSTLKNLNHDVSQHTEIEERQKLFAKIEEDLRNSEEKELLLLKKKKEKLIIDTFFNDPDIPAKYSLPNLIERQRNREKKLQIMKENNVNIRVIYSNLNSEHSQNLKNFKNNEEIRKKEQEVLKKNFRKSKTRIKFSTRNNSIIPPIKIKKRIPQFKKITFSNFSNNVHYKKCSSKKNNVNTLPTGAEKIVSKSLNSDCVSAFSNKNFNESHSLNFNFQITTTDDDESSPENSIGSKVRDSTLEPKLHMLNSKRCFTASTCSKSSKCNSQLRVNDNRNGISSSRLSIAGESKLDLAKQKTAEPLQTKIKLEQLMECKKILEKFEENGLQITEKSLVKGLVHPEEILHALKKKKNKKKSLPFAFVSQIMSQNLIKSKKNGKTISSNNDDSDNSCEGDENDDESINEVLLAENCNFKENNKKRETSVSTLTKKQKKVKEKNASDWFNAANILARPASSKVRTSLESLTSLKICKKESNYTKPKNVFKKLKSSKNKNIVINTKQEARAITFWKKDEFIKLKKKMDEKKLIKIKLEAEVLAKKKFDNKNNTIENLNNTNGMFKDAFSCKLKTKKSSSNSNLMNNNLNVGSGYFSSKIFAEKGEMYADNARESCNEIWFPSYELKPSLSSTSESLFDRPRKNWMVTGNASSSKKDCRVDSAHTRKSSLGISSLDVKENAFVFPLSNDTILKTIHVQKNFGSRYKPNVL